MIFRKKKKINLQDIQDIIEDNWATSFKFYQKKKLTQEKTENYSAGTHHGAFCLKLQKANIFAWVRSHKFLKYRDFVLEGRLQSDPENGYSAAGFVLRYINEENFYYFLISSKGYFRFDVLFNLNPISLIDWTQIPYSHQSPQDIRVICRRHFFSFFINDEWVGEIEDETIPEGTFGFAAQNFDEKDRAVFYLQSLSIDSRPVEREKAYYRWVHYIPVRHEYRISLAKSFFSTGKYSEAVIQLKKAFKIRDGNADEYFLLAESYLRAKLYDQALDALENCLKKEPAYSNAVLEKANVLYLLNRFIQTRDYILDILTDFKDNAPLLNCLGNCEYSLGNWQKAESAYSRATEIDINEPLYLTNIARTRERQNLRSEALRSYISSARLLFKQETYDELSLVLPHALKLAQEEDLLELKAIEGKMLYHEGKVNEAEQIFADLIEKECRDSAVYFLYGLIGIANGKRDASETYLKKASELEPGYALYWLRLAENRFILGKDPEQALKKAYDLDPDNHWINNLYGQFLMKQNKLEDAERYFERAKELAPGEVKIYRNYSEVLLKKNNLEGAKSLVCEGIRQAGEKPELYNQRGNIYAAENDFTQALRDYEKAIELEPDNHEYMRNCSACCIELDMIMRAEELLNRLLVNTPSADVYNLNGNLALLKREYRRAELSYQEALKLDSGNNNIRMNLLSLYIETDNYKKAKKLLKEVPEKDPEQPGIKELRERIHEKYESSLSCDSCGRIWWIPKEIPPQPAVKIRGEPPAEAPAGICPECARIYCIGCASKHVRNKRLKCAHCGEELKLSGDAIKYLLLSYIDNIDIID